MYRIYGYASQNVWDYCGNIAFLIGNSSGLKDNHEGISGIVNFTSAAYLALHMLALFMAPAWRSNAQVQAALPRETRRARQRPR
jgi:hypothetical protein